jgi:hypothetical protein
MGSNVIRTTPSPSPACRHGPSGASHGRGVVAPSAAASASSNRPARIQEAWRLRKVEEAARPTAWWRTGGRVEKRARRSLSRKPS